MISMNLLPQSTRAAQRGYAMSRQNLAEVSRPATPPAQAKDTVHFSGSAAGQSDLEFLEQFLKDNPVNQNKVASVLAPLTRAEKAESKAFHLYIDGIKQGKRPFLPKGYREMLVTGGYLKSDNKSWDVERSAFRRYITEDLYLNSSEEARNNGLREAGFKPKSRHKKAGKPAQETLQPVSAPPELARSASPQPELSQPKSPAFKMPEPELTPELPPELQETKLSAHLLPEKSPELKPELSPEHSYELFKAEKPTGWDMGFDWAEECASAPAFMEHAQKEQARLVPASTEQTPAEQTLAEQTLTGKAPIHQQAVSQSTPRQAGPVRGFGEALKQLLNRRP